MSKGRHASGNSTTPAGLAVGALMLAVGIALVPVVLISLFRYSPYEDPGAGVLGLWLGIIMVLAIGIPAAAVGLKGLAALHRSYSAWKKTLTPGQRAALAWAEAGAMLGAHLLWRHHNRERSAELTASVMGEPGELPEVRP